MKKLFFFTAAIICVALNHAQNVATLIHSGEETPFYGSEALVQALSSAVDGDTITLSDGTFTSCDIAKAVTIRGAGADIDNLWEPYAATVLSGTFRIMQPDSTAEKLTIEGIYHDDDIVFRIPCLKEPFHHFGMVQHSLDAVDLLGIDNHEILAGIGPVCEISHVEILDRYNIQFDRLLDVLWKKRTSRTVSNVIKQTITFMLENPKRNTRITDPLLYDRLNKRQLLQAIITSS